MLTILVADEVNVCIWLTCYFNGVYGLNLLKDYFGECGYNSKENKIKAVVEGLQIIVAFKIYVLPKR